MFLCLPAWSFFQDFHRRKLYCFPFLCWYSSDICSWLPVNSCHTVPESSHHMSSSETQLYFSTPEHSHSISTSLTADLKSLLHHHLKLWTLSSFPPSSPLLVHYPYSLTMPSTSVEQRLALSDTLALSLIPISISILSPKHVASTALTSPTYFSSSPPNHQKH